MTSSTISLIIEIALLAIGIYIYLFARGLVRMGKPEARARAEAFRQENGTWLRLLGLALAAIMAMNVMFHVRELMG
ncbi:hypothetical protein FUA23_06220 [Neolewinella aurantiaca]|uniref:Uncharacterized protein n=1 Tax=Neolewinella aurantiaca TaxID=2602767 RepID=A0A5C7FXV4_9BACT|nr:hypothetical protein [Neolewinella aurantiaca]TXF90382.1 hypothetical protein FUA23_06220 [Neolewinella aurantiaca]